MLHFFLFIRILFYLYKKEKNARLKKNSVARWPVQTILWTRLRAVVLLMDLCFTFKYRGRSIKRHRVRFVFLQIYTFKCNFKNNYLYKDARLSFRWFDECIPGRSRFTTVSNEILYNIIYAVVRQKSYFKSRYKPLLSCSPVTRSWKNAGCTRVSLSYDYSNNILNVRLYVRRRRRDAEENRCFRARHYIRYTHLRPNSRIRTQSAHLSPGDHNGVNITHGLTSSPSKWGDTHFVKKENSFITLQARRRGSRF